MKKFFTLVLLIFVVVQQQMFAVPAYPHPIDFEQIDGSTITIFIKGDERINWRESMDGYTLLFNQAGYLTYAQLDENGDLQPSEFIATDIEKRSGVVNSFLNTIEKGLFYSDIQRQVMLKIWEIEDDFEALRIEDGKRVTYKTLCAFVQFPEKKFTKTMNDFEPLMNQLGYTGGGAVGSVRDFFKESSYNKFDLIVTLCGIYTAPNSSSYYAGNSGLSKGSELGRWAAQKVAAEPHINFADYDSNNDGKVDGFHFIFAGRGQEAGGGAGTIWSHKSSFWPSVTKNGKSISEYSCSPELLYSNITTIGVICHEMTHAFGAPDFYDTNNSTGGQYEGTGYWDIMAGGSWNGSPAGNRPPHHNMYTKVKFGWVTPTVLSSPQVIVNMPNSAENPVAYRVNTKTNNEYYLLENRQRVKFDAAVPGDGLLIYHVHSNVGTSCINCTHQQKMYPVCASRTSTQMPTSGASNYGNINSSGCPFPGSSNQTSFTDTSAPPMKSWANANSERPITNISMANRLITFSFMGAGLPQHTVNLSASPPNGGTVDGGGTYTINTQITVKATPNAGFGFINWTRNGVEVSKNVNYTFFVAENTTLVANFGSSNANLASLTMSSGELTPDFSPTTTDYTVHVSNTVSTITITGVAQDANATVTDNVTDAPLIVGNNKFTINVKAQDNTTKKYSVTVVRLNSFTITASVEDNTGGTISPEGEVAVDEGGDITFSMSPDDGYYIEYVLIDGENVGTETTYQFTDVTSDHIIAVRFKQSTAIADVETQQIKIYPNPTEGEIQVTSYELRVTSIEIYDVFGRLVTTSSFGHTNTTTPSFGHPSKGGELVGGKFPSFGGAGVVLNISHLPSGVYFLKIQTENDVITRKIVKK
ncbi:MAG: M6 family metalloprotease domain-containing protein [Bacteroidales bacterium]|nr:M6 family metalloprotease domain-containing protein [Bacteroidales bacterium]